ncbi:hypothetical protein Nepgr_012127 [Nepenthes gracilis]|uniref:C3H1-type domain-containing protein n=1 Tax=Nepenthes gracilis TaxID=150966 RepID=A0AAD3SGY8_NEPGR|nr:hypothetical protein Nepgr_012127 [Nepenthes gracilis]
MEFGGSLKRGRPAFNGNGGPKKFKKESESFPTGVGSKSKPCTKFFSTSGCPFGETCHFLHYVPGGYKAVTQMMNLGSPTAPPPAPRTAAGPPSFPDSSSPVSVKTRLCNKYNTSEGCRFGDKCHFAHGESELGKPSAPSYGDDPRTMAPFSRRMAGPMEPPPPGLLDHPAAASFGASAAAKISVDASLAGAIIGKGGVNSKQICRVTGAKLSIRDHESDPHLKNIELEGTFDQIKQASTMVRELIVSLGSVTGLPATRQTAPISASNYKTKPCEKFAKGSCAFGDRCRFAHGAV